MKIIGLTGGSGSGKGVVCNILAELAIPTIDTDALYREITSSNTSCARALIAEFGEEIMSLDGGINRTSLASLVFAPGAEQRLSALNTIAHKYILDEVRDILKRLELRGEKIAFVDAPVLYESGFDKECDYTVAVIADRNIRIRRIMERDSLTYEKALARIGAQKSDDELIALSDFVIKNNDDVSALRLAVAELLQKINIEI